MFHTNILFVFIVVCWLYSTGECGVIASKKSLRGYMTGGNENFPMKTNLSELDCSQFIDDYDILRQFPFPILIHLAADEEELDFRTEAFMGENDTFVAGLMIYKESIVPWSIYCLSNLRTLQVHQTPFENNIIPDALANLKTLENFWVYDTTIVEITEQLRTLENITALIFDNCSLTYVPNVSNLENMWLFDLSFNRVSHLDEIPDVIFLDLEGNLFNYIPMMKNPEKLLFLVMNDNPLKNIAAIMSYKNLKGIYFKNTMITSIPSSIDKLQNLLDIDVSNNKLHHLPHNIVDLPNLEQLNISNNLLSPKEIQLIQKEFQKSHPTLKLTV